MWENDPFVIIVLCVFLSLVGKMKARRLEGGTVTWLSGFKVFIQNDKK